MEGNFKSETNEVWVAFEASRFKSNNGNDEKIMHSQFSDIPVVVVLTGLDIKSLVLFVWEWDSPSTNAVSYNKWSWDQHRSQVLQHC